MWQQRIVFLSILWWEQNLRGIVSKPKTSSYPFTAGMRQYEEDKARRESEFGHNTDTNDHSGATDTTPEKFQ